MLPTLPLLCSPTSPTIFGQVSPSAASQIRHGSAPRQVSERRISTQIGGPATCISGGSSLRPHQGDPSGRFGGVALALVVGAHEQDPGCGDASARLPQGAEDGKGEGSGPRSNSGGNDQRHPDLPEEDRFRNRVAGGNHRLGEFGGGDEANLVALASETCAGVSLGCTRGQIDGSSAASQVGMRAQGTQLPSRAETDIRDRLKPVQLTITGASCSQARTKSLQHRGARDSGEEENGHSTCWGWLDMQFDSSLDMQQQLSSSSIYHRGHCCSRDPVNVERGNEMFERREDDSAVQRENAEEDETAFRRQGHSPETGNKDFDGNIRRRNGCRAERGGKNGNRASSLGAVADEFAGLVSESEVESVLGAATTNSPSLNIQQATTRLTVGGERTDLAELVLENSGGFSFIKKSRPLPRQLESRVEKVETDKGGSCGLEEDSSSIYKQLWALEGEADEDKRRARVVGEVVPSLPPPRRHSSVQEWKKNRWKGRGRGRGKNKNKGGGQDPWKEGMTVHQGPPSYGFGFSYPGQPLPWFPGQFSAAFPQQQQWQGMPPPWFGSPPIAPGQGNQQQMRQDPGPATSNNSQGSGASGTSDQGGKGLVRNNIRKTSRILEVRGQLQALQQHLCHMQKGFVRGVVNQDTSKRTAQRQKKLLHLQDGYP